MFISSGIRCLPPPFLLRIHSLRYARHPCPNRIHSVTNTETSNKEAPVTKSSRMIYRTVNQWMTFLLVTTVMAHSDEPPRDGRWFWGNVRGATETNIVTRKLYVTKYEPSSCAMADPTLLPCLNARQLNLMQPSKAMPIDRSISPHGFQPTIHQPGRPSHPLRPFVQPSEQETTGVWSWFRSSPRKTVVHTIIEPSTVRRQDPKDVVTYLVQGCLPSKLPFDLTLCPDNNVSSVERSDGESTNGRSSQHHVVYYAAEEYHGKERNN